MQIFRRVSIGRIDLAQEFLICKVLQYNGICRAFGVADTVTLAKDGIHPGFSALRSFTELYGTIGAGRNTCPAGDTIVVRYLANRTRGDDGIVGEQR